MHYHISYSDVSSQFIQLAYTIPNIHQDVLHLQLPAWRPGRYELQNFAKNIRKLRVTDAQGNPIDYKKITKDRWEIYTHATTSITVSYEYYADTLNAGSTFLCNDFLYINPVNCMMYTEGRADEPYELTFELPETYIIATQLKSTGKHTLSAPDFEYLADSPLIASASLEHHVVSGKHNNKVYNLHIWFQGKHPFDAERLKKDTLTYAAYQIESMGEMPCSDYHFLYLMLDQPFRHGVEHLDSTVIAMGKLADQTVEEFYHDLLAISSHELFHLWNIKRIRPLELFPYDYTKENYSTLGYVYEGVTTYLGDLFLLKSGVWSWEQYAASLASDLYRHFTNEGRFNYSLVESSWDTWLDGYVAGVPGRKTSIYIEGLIAAWCADVWILKNSGGKKSLMHLMNELYRVTYKKGKPYDENLYLHLIESYTGMPIADYKTELIYGKGFFDKWIEQICEDLGIKITFIEHNKTLKLSPYSESDVSNALFSKWVL